MFEILIHSPLFKGLSVDVLKKVMDGITFRLKHCEKGEIIAHSGDEIVSQAIVIKGSIKGEMIDFAGKVIKIEDIEAPRPLAPAFLFGKNNTYPVNIVANTDVELLMIPKQEMIRLMQRNDLILSNFIDNVSNRAQFLTSKIKFLSFSTIKGKIAQYILDLHGQTDAGPSAFPMLILPHSQSQLAELFGVARPSVGRALSEMNADKILKVEGRKISHVDLNALKRLLR